MDNRHDTVKLALYERFLNDASALPPMPDTSLRLRQLHACETTSPSRSAPCWKAARPWLNA